MFMRISDLCKLGFQEGPSPVVVDNVIALTAAATFSILDTYVPSMAVSARSGAGFGIGANLVGFPRM